MLTGTSFGNITDELSYNSFGEAAAYKAFSSAANIFSVNYTRDDLGSPYSVPFDHVNE